MSALTLTTAQAILAGALADARTQGLKPLAFAREDAASRIIGEI